MNCHAELDPLEASSLLSASERSLRDAAARATDERLLPRSGARSPGSPPELSWRAAAARATDERLLPLAAGAFEKGEMPDAAVSALAQMGAFGASIHLGPMAYGLMMQEIERADSGFRSCASVQTSLVMWPIHSFGTEEQKARWLPRLRTGEALGCFALTEPQSGSDPASLQTRAVRDGTNWKLTGHKRWDQWHESVDRAGL